MNKTATKLPQSCRLTPEQVAQFHAEGYLAPVTLCSPEEMAEIRAEIERDIIDKPSVLRPKEWRQSRHLDKAVVWKLCSNPVLVGTMQSILGEDLILWRSHFFDKKPFDSSEIPWHQDINYWPLEPALNVSAWVAIDNVTVENSCVQVIPGSHKKAVPHIKKTADHIAFGEEADPAYVEVDKAVDIELKPGQCLVFTEKLLHHSHPNRSANRRLGLAVRITVPFVRVDHEALFPGHACIQLGGQDRMGFNRMTEPPIG